MGGELGMEVMCLWIASFHGYDLDTTSTFYVTKKKKIFLKFKTKSLIVYEIVGITTQRKEAFQLTLKHSICRLIPSWDLA